MEISAHITLNRLLAESICLRLAEEIDKLGFAVAELTRYPYYDQASFVLIKDPYTGQQNLACYWYEDAKSQRIGSLQFNSDGTFYAEYDLVKLHLGKANCFVEGVTAWGKGDQIKSEAKLLAMPD
jgi:hypothetical protein